MIDVLVPPVATDLTTLDAVRDELGDLGASHSDARLLRVIRRVSSLIASAITLHPLQTVVETVPAGENGACILSAAPIRSIAWVANGFATAWGQPGAPGESDEITEYAVDYQSGVILPVSYDGTAQSLPGFAYTPYWGAIRDLALMLPPQRRVVTVSYQGGWIMPGQPERDLPDDIEDACIQLVRDAVSLAGRDPSVRSETVEGAGSVTYFDAKRDSYAVPPVLSDLIARYRPVRL